MEFEAQVSLKEQGGKPLSEVDIPINQTCELVHSSGRKGCIKTSGVVVNGDANALSIHINYQLEDGDLTIADFEDSLSILNEGNNLKVASIH